MPLAALTDEGGRDRDARAFIADLPFYPQDDYQCGPAALATVLGGSGLQLGPEALVSEVYIPGRHGSFQHELTASARQHERLAYPLEGGLPALFDELDAGHAVLVLQNLGLSWYPQWHYAVVRGYDLADGVLLLNSGTIENYRLKLGTFARTWQRSGQWALVVMPPGQLPVSANADSYFAAILPQLSGDSAAAAPVQEALLLAGLRRWPDTLDLLMAHGNLLYQQNRKPEALARFEQATRLHPDYAYAWNNQAVVAAELGLRAQALAAVATALQLAPAGDAIVTATWHELQ